MGFILGFASGDTSFSPPVLSRGFNSKVQLCASSELCFRKGCWFGTRAAQGSGWDGDGDGASQGTPAAETSPLGSPLMSSFPKQFLLGRGIRRKTAN